MGSILWWTGVVVGALALAALIVHGFGVAVGMPFGGVLDTYEIVSQAMFGKFEPAIEHGLALLQNRTGHALHLYPHWKHVFLLLWIYVLADLRSAVEQNKFVTALILFLFGTVVAFIASIGAGTVPLDGEAPASSHTLLLAFPVLGVTLHQVAWCLLESVGSRAAGESAVMRFIMFVREEVVPIALGGATAVALCFYSRSIPLLAQSSDPGVALLVAALVSLAVFHLWRGGVYAALDRHPDENWWRTVARTGSARLAAFMLATLCGAALIFATDAAMKFA